MTFTDADLYVYRVEEFLGNYDGDTIDVLVDLGLKAFLKMRIRLYGVNTPELRGEDKERGLIARDWVTSRLEAASSIYIRTYKDQTGKYGRWLAEVFVDGINLGDELLAKNLAVRYDGS